MIEGNDSTPEIELPKVNQAERENLIQTLIDLYSMTYESLDSQRVYNRIQSIGRKIAINSRARRIDAGRTFKSDNIVLIYRDYDIYNNFNFPNQVFTLDLDRFVKVSMEIKLDPNIYNFYVTEDGGVLDDFDVNVITMVLSAHRSKNSQLLSNGEIISPVVDMSFYLPDIYEQKKVYGNF